MLVQRSWKLGLILVVAALGCGDDAGTGQDASADSSETTPDTSPPDETSAPGDTTPGEDTGPAEDTSPPGDTSPPDDTAADSSPDTTADTTPDGTADTSPPSDTSEPPRTVYDPIPGRWSEDFAFSLPGLQAEVGPRAYDMIVEPVSGDVIVGGLFDRVGDMLADNVARWRPDAGWSTLGDGLAITVHALAGDGAGAVYAGGRGQSGGFGIPEPAPIARWDGQSWEAIGWVDAYAPVWSLAWIDGALIVGGEFTAIMTNELGDTVEAAYLARWDGDGWKAFSEVGGPDGPVHTIVKHGDEICVGGHFTTPGAHVACYGEGGWRALGDGLNSVVHVLHSEDGGALMAGGYFSFGDPLGPPEQFFVGLARFAAGGEQWAPVAGGVLNGAITNVWEIAPTGDGGLFIGGNFNQVNAAMPRVARNFARLDGLAWTPLGDVTNELGATLPSEVGVRAVVPVEDGWIVAGLFSTTGGETALNVSHLGGGKWKPLVEVHGPNLGVAGNINSLAYGPDGSLYAGGYFQSAGGVSTPNIARLSNAPPSAPNAIAVPAPELRWHPMGAGLDDTVWVVHATDDGAVWAGGLFTGGFARWDGSRWAVPAPMDGDVRAIADHDGAIYLGGTFTTIGLDDGLAHIARYQAGAFEALGAGLNERVNAIAVAADGTLYAGGFFTGTGDFDAERKTGTELHYVARWTGAVWEDLGGGLDGFVRDLAFWGDDLIAVGQFEHAGGVSVSSIARWDGERWSPIGRSDAWRYDWGGPLQLGALAVQDNGFFVTGAFNEHWIGETVFNGIAWFDGTDFEPLGQGPNDLAEDVVITPDGRGAFIGGPFLRVDGRPSLGLALWQFDDMIGTPAADREATPRDR